MNFWRHEMQFNEIIVLGAGAIGSLYGGLLSEAHPVTLIGRKHHVKEIKKHGLTIAGSVFKKLRVQAKEEIDRIPKNCLLILACKVTDSEQAINSIKAKLQKDTVILVMQNGLGSEDIVKKIVPNEVIRAIIMTGTKFVKPGTVALSQLRECNINESESSKRIERAFRKANLPCEIVAEKEFRK